MRCVAACEEETPVCVLVPSPMTNPRPNSNAEEEQGEGNAPSSLIKHKRKESQRMYHALIALLKA